MLVGLSIHWTLHSFMEKFYDAKMKSLLSGNENSFCAGLWTTP